MNQITRLIIWLYVLMVHLYPRRLRAEFKEEMTTAFAQAITEAAEQDELSFTALTLALIMNYAHPSKPQSALA